MSAGINPVPAKRFDREFRINHNTFNFAAAEVYAPQPGVV
jgi:hypothetical protein